MKHLAVILATVLAACAASAQPAHSTVVKHVDVFKEQGRFAGWPANNGIWSWGDEVVVGFSLGYYKLNPTGGHAIDRDRPSMPMQARTLDGGETWSIERPSFVNEEGKEPDAVEPKGGINFKNPDMALKFRGDRFYHSPDRCKTWEGPFKLPTFGRSELESRTDYIVGDENTLTAFASATKANGNEGQPLCMRTEDGGKTWNLVGWIGQEPPEGYGYSIMPSTLQLNSNTYLSAIRRAGVFDGVRRWWIEMFLSPDLGQSWYLLDKPYIDTGGNPPSMIKLQDGRIVLTYGWRNPPEGMRAIFSDDNGQTWGEEVVLRADAASWDIGYPRTVQRKDGKLLTIYYFHHPDQPERYIACTIWEPGTPAAAE